MDERISWPPNPPPTHPPYTWPSGGCCGSAHPALHARSAGEGRLDGQGGCGGGAAGGGRGGRGLCHPHLPLRLHHEGRAGRGVRGGRRAAWGARLGGSLRRSAGATAEDAGWADSNQPACKCNGLPAAQMISLHFLRAARTACGLSMRGACAVRRHTVADQPAHAAERGEGCGGHRQRWLPQARLLHGRCAGSEKGSKALPPWRLVEGLPRTLPPWLSAPLCSLTRTHAHQPPDPLPPTPLPAALRPPPGTKWYGQQLHAPLKTPHREDDPPIPPPMFYFSLQERPAREGWDCASRCPHADASPSHATCNRWLHPVSKSQAPAGPSIVS